MHELLQHRISTVTIEFDGSGDEGQIDRIRCIMLDDSEGSLAFPSAIPGTMIPAGATVWDSRQRQYVTQPVERPATMAEVLEDWAYKLLDRTGVDWVNNGGGFGEIVITPATDTIECDVNQRFIDVISTHREL